MAQRTRSHFKSSALHKFRKRLPHIAGKIQRPQRAHRAFAAQFHRTGHTRFDGRRGFCRAAVMADMLCQRFGRHGAGRVRRHRHEPHRQRGQQKL